MKHSKVHAGLYRAGPYLISMVRKGYWEIWLGDDQVDVEGWSAWPSLAAAYDALDRHLSNEAAIASRRT